MLYEVGRNIRKEKLTLNCFTVLHSPVAISFVNIIIVAQRVMQKIFYGATLNRLQVLKRKKIHDMMDEKERKRQRERDKEK